MFQVATPISPTSSDATEQFEGQVSTPKTIKSVQTNNTSDHPKKIRKAVQTTLSSIELNKFECPNVRKSKSEHDGSNSKNVDFRIRTLQWLDDVFSCNVRTDSKNNGYDKVDAQLRKLCEFGDRPKSETKFDDKCPFNTSEHAYNLNFLRNNYATQIYRAEVIPFKIAEAKERKEIIKEWLNKIPLKSHDFLERPVERQQILNSIAVKLKDVSTTTPEFLKNKLISEIIEMLHEMPIDMSGCNNNKRNYLNTCASLLIERLCKIGAKEHNSNYRNVYSNTPNRVQFKTDIRPNENELKDFINDELSDFLEKSRIEINSQRIEQIEIEILGVILDNIASIRASRDENVTTDIVTLLQQTAGLFEHQALYITNLLLEHLRQMLLTNEEPPQTRSNTNRFETVMMMQNSTLNSLNDSSIAGITEGDIEHNLNIYIEQLCQQIDEWLTGLQILRSHEQTFRQVVIHDLAGDIVDRHKYLELNPSSRGNDEEELKNLKFQIFKWINKLVGENQTETIEHALDLMRRIRNVPVPMLTRPGGGISTYYSPGNVSQMPMFGPQGPGGSMIDNRQRNTVQGRLSGPEGYVSGPMYDSVNVNQIPMFGLAGPGGSMKEQPPATNCRTFATGRTSAPGALGIPASPGSRNQSVHPPKTMQELNDEFDDFVKKWVQEIPIAANSPEEQELLPQMRIGLYNGIWKAITKLKCQPDVLCNPFYFEDKLDDEIEALYAMLPQSSELEANRHRLKVNLIEKTSHINDQIKNAAQSESFKQRLIDNMDVYIPRLETDEANEDPIRLHEEMEILFLAEEYILYRRFQNEDPIKAGVYRNKLLKRVQELVQEIKRFHGKEMKDINPDLYSNDILTALHQVPLPNDDTIKQEADQILLGLEIEKWYTDLPIARNDDIGEKIKRRRLRDALGRKIYDMETSMDFSDSNAERALKHEISRFLERVPLGRDESLNINFMVEELTNRMKNRPRAPGKGKKVLFDESIDYQNFSKNVPCKVACSSRIDEAIGEISRNLSAQVNESIAPCSIACNSRIEEAVADASRNISAQLNQSAGLDGSIQQAQFSQQGRQSFTPDISIISGSGFPTNSVIQGYSGFAQQRPVSPSLNATDAGFQGPYLPNTSIQSPGGYTSFDQQRPVSSSLNAPPVQYIPQQGSPVQQVGAGQASMPSYISGPADQSGAWMSLHQSRTGPEINMQNISGRQPIPQVSPTQQSFRPPLNYSSVQQHAPNAMVQSSMGYESFGQDRPAMHQTQAGGIEYVSIAGSSGKSMHGTGQVSMVQPRQNMSVNVPHVSMLPSPPQVNPGNISEQQWMSLYNTADPNMARQNMSAPVQSTRQASHAQQYFRNATMPNTSFLPQPNPVVQSPLGFPIFDQERPTSSSFSPQNSGVQYTSLLSATPQGQAAMIQPANISVQGQGIPAYSSPHMQEPAISPRQQTMQSDLSGRSILAKSIAQGAAPRKHLQASQANSGVGNVSVGAMGISVRTPTMNGGVGTSAMRTAGPGQGLSTSLPPRYMETGQPAPGFYGSTDQEGIMRFTQYNRSLKPGPGLLQPSSPISAYGQPSAGFSTPQQGVMPGSTPVFKRKQMREGVIPQRDSVRRRLDLDDDDIVEEIRGPCRCMEKLKRYRKHMRYPCPSYEMEFQQQPMRCYYPHYF